VPLYLLITDFSFKLSVTWCITHFLRSQINNHHCDIIWSELVCTICHVNVLLYVSYVRCWQSQSHFAAKRCHIYKALLSVSIRMSFTFPPHKLFFLKSVYQHGSIFKTYRANYCTYAKAPMCYQYFSIIYYMLVADNINSQESEDCKITDKLL
jgi:hypothetical protein